MQSEAGLRLPHRNELKRLGIFGGTFDPIHYGHLICAEQLREVIGLDLVLFVPCSSPPHKPHNTSASSAHRMEMASLATRPYDCFMVSGIEVDRGGISYTIDTVEQIRESVGKEVELWLLMGMDTYIDFPTWRSPDRIAAECRFGVACRPGYVRDLDSGLPADKSRFVDITLVEISSTDIRERICRGESIRFLVPGSVEDYIRRYRPYASASNR